MPDTCSTCKFWEHWRVVLLADDEPKAVGHCVIPRNPIADIYERAVVRGLTAHDFYCPSYIPDTAENTGGDR
jgi:hypothetical protein